MPEQTGSHLRRIRSFVLRTGRMTAGQKHAYNSLWPKWGLYSQQGLQDFDQLFGRVAPRILEIGFGMGKSLAVMAESAPDHDFIGVEVHRPGVGKLLALVEEHKLSNVRVYCEDAIDVLTKAIDDQSLDKVQIFFPDPWHKTRHHKRRLIQLSFVNLLASKLKKGGLIHFATDWENYAQHMLAVMNSSDQFKNLAEDGTYVPRPADRPLTKFENRGQRLGHGVWDLQFKKI